VVRIGHFEKFLEMIFGLLSLALEVMLGSHYALLFGVADFLIVDAVAGYYGDVMALSLLPLLATLSTFPGAHGSGLGGYGSATIIGRFHVA
jgi:hypothetical protein